MLLQLPQSLHYPITILSVLSPVSSRVSIDDILFRYSYVSRVKIGDRYTDEETEVDKKYVAEFKSTLEGTIRGWRVWEGDVLHGPVDIVEIEEECAHTVQYLGMCTNCGMDMTTVQDVERATLKTLHDNRDLTISREEARKIDEEAKRRLIKSRKLSLVVDLDQTIIHAAVDPTIAEWQKDRDNPNHEAVSDVRSFQLVDESPGMRGCWYYVKLRPGLQEFLEHISQLYELHIYTMGTRQYATEIAKIVDPDKRYFGDRVLSRDESGSAAVKNLERLFPVDTKMVVIIDDRGDVWKWSANLIRVTPFDFFVGIGDINSAYLPRRQEIQATPDKEPKIEGVEQQPNGNHKYETNGVTEDGASLIQENAVLEQLTHMGASEDPAVLAMQSKGQEEAISSQLEGKPLLKMQQLQDAQDEREAEASAEPGTEAISSDVPATQASSTTESESGSSTDSERSHLSNKAKTRHSILKNDDEELVHLESRLAAVHAKFFGEYDRNRIAGKGGRVSHLSGNKKVTLSQEADDGLAADLQLIPDVTKVMPAMKVKVLSGVTIVFSGVLPLGTDIQNADISIWAKTFGAKITDQVGRDVTHVIAARVGTAKVKKAVKRGIKVVGTNWLLASLQRWRKLDEDSFLLVGTGQKRTTVTSSSEIGDDLEKTQLTSRDFMLSSDEEGETTTGFVDTDGDDDFVDDKDGQPQRKKPRLQIKVEDVDAETDTGDEFIDDGSPVTINQDEWADMDAELKEFMGSDVDSESEAESVSTTLSFRDKSRSNKRRREDDNDDSGGGGGGGRDEYASKPTIRPNPKRVGSTLKTVSNLASDSSSTTPTAGADDDDTILKLQADQEAKESRHNMEEETSDDELARELERELEEAEAEEEANDIF